jgi:hypothetical protein
MTSARSIEGGTPSTAAEATSTDMANLLAKEHLRFGRKRFKLAPKLLDTPGAP